jgi:proteasome lid subunit RPN8/RPN11
MRPDSGAPDLALAPGVYEDMLSHCLGEQPIEAVGLLSGLAGLAIRSHPLRNVLPAPRNQRAFLAAPFDQFLAERAARSAGLEILASYHSHPDGGPSLSAADLAWARIGAIHLVVAFRTSGNPRPVARAFRFGGEGRVTPVALRVGAD